MSKLVLLSIIIATMVIPNRLAQIKSRTIGFKKLKRWMFLCCLIYILLLLYVYPRLESS
jgi:hypothetical protein